jgi:hypothetical protein
MEHNNFSSVKTGKIGDSENTFGFIARGALFLKIGFDIYGRRKIRSRLF